MTKRVLGLLALLALTLGLGLTAVTGCGNSDFVIVAPPDSMDNDPGAE